MTTGTSGGRQTREYNGPLALRGHLFHCSHRSDRVRDRNPDPAGVRSQIRGAGARLRRARVRLLGYAVPGDGAARPAVGSDRPPTHSAHHDGDQRPGLRFVRLRPFVRGIVRRPRDLRVREWQHLGGAGVYGRHHVAGGARPRHGGHWGRVRDRIRARPSDRRARRPLRGSPRARAHSTSSRRAPSCGSRLPSSTAPRGRYSISVTWWKRWPERRCGR